MSAEHLQPEAAVLWGEAMQLFTVVDFRYLPGAWGLFNSAVMNGFAGQFIIWCWDLPEEDGLPGHPQLVYRRAPERRPGVHGYASRLAVLTALDDGTYLQLDSDMIVERPCGPVFEPINVGLLLSSEPEPKADPHDWTLYHQAKRVGISPKLPSFPFINGGFLGFRLPRDRAFTETFARRAERLFAPGLGVFDDPVFPLIDQDLLNLCVREYLAQGGVAFSISTRQMEVGSFAVLFRNRPFPWTLQRDLQPADQLKYLIHGSALRRPWMQHQRGSVWRRVAERTGLLPALRRVRRTAMPYERAWAYYATRKQAPIPFASWARKHGLRSRLPVLWKWGYSLPCVGYP